MREEKLIAIMDAIYTEMYEKADPPANFAELKKKYAGTEYQVWRDHSLSMVEQEKIIARHCDIKGITNWEKQKIHTSVLLGCSPISK
jgi:hypothetical protein